MPLTTGIPCSRRPPVPPGDIDVEQVGVGIGVGVVGASTVGLPVSCVPGTMALALSIFLCGCWSGYGSESDQDGTEAAAPSGVAPQQTSSALSGDLVSPSAAPEAPVEVTAAALATSADPKVFYLSYADGQSLNDNNPNPCRDAAPKFVCDFAPTLVECQRQIQTYLDRWYAPFNIIFTLTPPKSGAYYTEVVSSGGGAWCDSAANVAGIAPFLCDDLNGGVAYTFMGGKTAKDTAIIIAQEQAHLLGLEHTLSPRDIMDPTVCPDCDGFEDVNNTISNDRCNRSKQNSYAMMLDRLGPWTGGTKPTPFGCEPDQDAPLVQILTPADKAAVGETFPLRVQATDQCKVTKVTVSVTPMGLHAQSSAGPYEWVLTKIDGLQTVTVTAFDTAGRQSVASITVNAGSMALTGAGGTVGAGSPGTPSGEAGMAASAGGCQLAGCALGTPGQAGGDSPGWAWSIAGLAVLAASLLGRSRRRASTMAR